eukprot:4781181-Amphidinium_carterae.1
MWSARRDMSTPAKADQTAFIHAVLQVLLLAAVEGEQADAAVQALGLKRTPLNLLTNIATCQVDDVVQALAGAGRPFGQPYGCGTARDERQAASLRLGQLAGGKVRDM